MHELGIAESILELTVNEAKKQNAKAIKQINLVIGELSSVVDSSLELYWELICEDTIAVGSVLFFKKINAEFSCVKCGFIFPRNTDLLCPVCGGNAVLSNAAKEFYIESIEIE